MVTLPERTCGIVACSGEELAEGTVTRLAALKVLNELRRAETVTICLPLFLAGGEGDRAFARFHPTITVDGCELRCAARGTEMYSAKPAASLVVSELLAEHGLPRPEGRRRLDAAGERAVEVTASRLVALVDEVLGRPGRSDAVTSETAEQAGDDAKEVTCSCGSGIPVSWLEIGGQRVEVVALPPILQMVSEGGRPPGDVVAEELLAAVKVYNMVPADAESSWREALLAEYAALTQREAGQ